jgi:hypothetical protein
MVGFVGMVVDDVDEYVVFCGPTRLQRLVYKALLESQGLFNCLHHGDISVHLKAITIMRKICNAVTLIKSKVHSVLPPPPPLLPNTERRIRTTRSIPR